MKITLMEAVMANLAAEEVGRQAVPYSLALALMKVKQATAAEAETFAAEERKLVEKCDIPIFHDDQHGTAIITCAAILNA